VGGFFLLLIVSCVVSQEPTAAQLAYQRMERGAIVHFNIATSAGTQGCSHGEVPNPSMFAPTKLNIDSWTASMNGLGIKYAVLVAKHNCGFCTWPTAVQFPAFNFSYTYSVNSSTFKGNVVKDFVASCQKAGIKPGFYYSIVTNSFLNVVNGNVQDGPLKPGQVRVTQDQYYQIVLAQLNELWTQFGDLAEIWFDGGYQGSISQQLSALLVDKQPNAVIFNGYGLTKNPVRWVGTESGHAPYPNWATGTSNGGDPNSKDWCPAECDFTLQNDDTWFYNPNVGVHSLKDLVSIYHDSVGHGCNFLIDYAPTPDGILPDEAVSRYKELGDYLNSCYGSPVATISGGGNPLTLNLVNETEIDRIVIQEDIAQGQRVRNYAVEGLVSGTWKSLSSGSSIGYKKIDLLPSPMTVSSVQIFSDKSTDTPVWYSFSVFKPCAPL